jgi:hypothetical protein
VPPSLIEALRDLIRREQAELRHRPARVYLPGRTITGSALIRLDGWLDVYDKDIAEELATKLERVGVQLVKAQRAGDRLRIADLERDADALQREITQRETVLCESFPPQRIVSIEWLLDDEPATGCDLFGYAEVN